MRLHLALSNTKKEYYVASSQDVRNYLISYAVVSNPVMEMLQNPDVSLMVDSGAFSAWRRGVKISLNAYISYLQAIIERAKCRVISVNLDVIPGKWGRKPTTAEIEYSASMGWDNYQRLKEDFPTVVHVFHQHEDFKWLEGLAEEGYIGISPANDVSSKAKNEWLSGVFNRLYEWGYLTPPNILKTHAFGLTKFDLLYHYPFYSADSTSWKVGAMYGKQLKWVVSGRVRSGGKILGGQSYAGDYNYRMGANIQPFLKAEDLATRLWESRGVTWDD